MLAVASNDLDRLFGLPAAAPVTLDMYSSLSDIYGRGDKDGLAAFNYEGRKGIRTQLVSWSERRRILAADRRRGSASEKPPAAPLLRGALQTCPMVTDQSQPAATPASSASRSCSPAAATTSASPSPSPRRPDIMNLRYQLRKADWRPALDMHNTEVAKLLPPGGWQHEAPRTINRRVRISANELSKEPRNRLRLLVPRASPVQKIPSDVW